MSKKKRNKPEKETIFLERLAALSSTADDNDKSILEEELRDCGIDPAELRKVAHDKLRRFANHNYSSIDKECPPKLKEFLRQMRPPTAEEEQRREKSQAASKINDLLSSIRSGISSAVNPPTSRMESPAHAFRNKKKDLTQRDQDLLKLHQSEIDSESGDENDNDH